MNVANSAVFEGALLVKKETSADEIARSPFHLSYPASSQSLSFGLDSYLSNRPAWSWSPGGCWD